MRGDRSRLLDIIEAIENIERYAVAGREAFEGDERTQVWFVHHLQIIGEASRNVSESVRASHPEIDWSGPVSMRNILVHQYFGIDLEIVWGVIENRLPTLKQAIAAILAALPDPDAPPVP